MNKAPGLHTHDIPIDLENRFIELRRDYLDPLISEDRKEELREKILNMVPYLRRQDLLAALVSDFGEANVYARLGQVHRDEVRRWGYSGLEELAANHSKLEVISDLNKGRNPTKRGDAKVTLFSGQFVHREVDLRIKGRGFDFVFSRTYKNQVIYSGPLGANWDHNYNLWLRVEDGGVRVARSTGMLHEDTFVRDEVNGSFKIPDGTFTTLTFEICLIGSMELGSRYVLETSAGTRYIYREMESDTGLYKVEFIVDRFGNTMQFSYDHELRLESVVDTLGKEISFFYDEFGRVITLKDNERQLQYCYDHNNDLVRVILPTPADDETPPMICYEYTSSDIPFPLLHNLTTIIDAEGHHYLENQYGIDQGQLNYNKVIWQRVGKGEFHYEYLELYPEHEETGPEVHYPRHKTVVITRNNQTVEYVFNANGNLLCKCECMRGTGELNVPISSEYKYNLDGKVIWQKDSLGNITQFMYGREAYLGEHPLIEEKRKFGNLLRIIQRSRNSATVSLDNFEQIDPDDIIVNYEYENKYNQLTAQTDPRNEGWRTEYIYTDDPADPEYESYEGTYLAKIRLPLTTLPNGLTQEHTLRFKHNEKGQIKAVITSRKTFVKDGELLVKDEPFEVVDRYYYYGEEIDDEPGVVDEAYKSGYLHMVKSDYGLNKPDRQFQNIRTTFDVDRLGNVLCITNGRGHQVARTYDQLDRLIEIVFPLNSTTLRNHYTNNNRLKRSTIDNKDPNANPDPVDPFFTVEYCYDEMDNPVKVGLGIDSSLGETITQHFYTASDRLCKTIDPKGNIALFSYNERDLVESITRGFGTEIASTNRYVYDKTRRVVKIIDGEGYQAKVEYDEFNRVEQLIDADENKVRFEYDKSGNVLQKEFFDKRGNRLSHIQYDYDERSRLRQKIDFWFEQPGDPEVEVRNRFFYDEENNLIRVVNDKDQKTDYEYDTLNRLHWTIDNLGNEIKNEYDENGNITKVVTVEKELDDTGAEIAREVFVTVNEYDALNRLTKTIDNLANVEQIWYDSRGNIVKVEDSIGNISKYDYDVFSRKIAIKKLWQEAGREISTRFFYDQNNLLSRIEDEAGHSTTYQYDSLNRQTAINYPDGSQLTTSYDRNDNIKQVIDPNHLISQYSYDALNRLQRVDIDRSELRIPSGHIVLGTNFAAYEYDGLGRVLSAENDNGLIEYTYDSFSFMLNEAFERKEVRSTYDLTGFRTGLVYPNGRELHLTSDGLNRISSIVNEHFGTGDSYPGDKNDEDLVVNQFVGPSRLRSKTFANGARTEFDYDGGGRVTSINHSKEGGLLIEFQSLYDGNGNKRVEKVRKAASEHGKLYGYDSLDRLVEARMGVTIPSIDIKRFRAANNDTDLNPERFPTQSEIDAFIRGVPVDYAEHFQYELDSLGNRSAKRKTGESDIIYETNELNQYSRVDGKAYKYDYNGNLIDDGHLLYFYDYQNKLVEVRDSTRTVAKYKYDATGRRIEKNIGRTITRFIYDGLHVIEERNDAGEVLAQYVYGGGLDNILQMARDNRNYYYHHDSLGSVMGLSTKEDGRIDEYGYTPFGELVTYDSGLSNPYLFAGSRFDKETELYYFRARSYSPKLGRFLQRDPKEYVDGMNLYEYVGNNPMNLTDPMGMEQGRRLGREGRPTPPPRGGSMQLPVQREQQSVPALTLAGQGPEDNQAWCIWYADQMRLRARRRYFLYRDYEHTPQPTHTRRLLGMELSHDPESFLSLHARYSPILAVGRDTLERASIGDPGRDFLYDLEGSAYDYVMTTIPRALGLNALGIGGEYRYLSPTDQAVQLGITRITVEAALVLSGAYQIRAGVTALSAFRSMSALRQVAPSIRLISIRGLSTGSIRNRLIIRMGRAFGHLDAATDIARAYTVIDRFRGGLRRGRRLFGLAGAYALGGDPIEAAQEAALDELGFEDLSNSLGRYRTAGGMLADPATELLEGGGFSLLERGSEVLVESLELPNVSESPQLQCNSWWCGEEEEQE